MLARALNCSAKTGRGTRIWRRGGKGEGGAKPPLAPFAMALGIGLMSITTFKYFCTSSAKLHYTEITN